MNVSAFFFKAIAADFSRNNESAALSENMQQTLIELVFRNLTPSEVQEVTRNEKEVCGGENPWKYLQCSEGIITSIGIIYREISLLEVEFMPPTVKMIVISGCSQRFFLNVRALPRRSTHIDLSSNFLSGHVDLTNLPPRALYFNVSMNRLNGPIDLTNLPSTMKEIDLSGNRIQQHIVYYAKLPSRIRRINIRKNNIHMIQPTDPLDAVSDKGIFWKMESRMR